MQNETCVVVNLEHMEKNPMSAVYSNQETLFDDDAKLVIKMYKEHKNITINCNTGANKTKD